MLLQGISPSAPEFAELEEEIMEVTHFKSCTTYFT